MAAVAAERVAANRRARRLLGGAPTLVLGVLGLLVGLVGGTAGMVAGALLGIALGGALAAAAPSLGARLVLRRVGAEVVDPEREPRYANLVDGLSETAGIPPPRLYVAPHDAANALVVSAGPADAAVVVTRGLLRTLNRVELEGVLAHELCHVRDQDALTGTARVVLGGLPGLLWQAHRDGPGPLLAAAAVLTLPAAPLRRLAAPPRRELEADEAGAYLTRYPPGLASALAKLGQLSSGGEALDKPGLNHLWLVAPHEPGSGSWWQRLYQGTHPPLQERIEALREL
jgi:heat shock protein HtpX